jgi:hypothetical protein
MVVEMLACAFLRLHRLVLLDCWMGSARSDHAF